MATFACPGDARPKRLRLHDQRAPLQRYSYNKTGCGSCEQRHQCLCHPERSSVPLAAIFKNVQRSPIDLLQSMKDRIGSHEGRRRYSQRFRTVEAVLCNIRHNKRLDRFTLRGRRKAGVPWRSYRLLHHIEKLAGREMKMKK